MLAVVIGLLRRVDRPPLLIVVKIGSRRSAWDAVGKLFEQVQEGCDDFRLRINLQASRSGWPSGIASQRVLLGRWNISLRAIGQFKVDQRLERRLRFELHTGNAENFVGDRGDRQITNPNRLQEELGILVFIQPDCLFGVNLWQVGGSSIASIRVDRTSPLEALVTRQSPFQIQSRFGYLQWNRVAILDGIKSVECDRGQFILILTASEIWSLGFRIIHPMLVTAGPL